MLSESDGDEGHPYATVWSTVNRRLLQFLALIIVPALCPQVGVSQVRAELVSWYPSKTTILLGETFDFTIAGRNAGSETSSDGYLSLSFPSLTDRTDGSLVTRLSGTSSDGTVATYTSDSILNTANGTVRAEYVLVEWNEKAWTAGEVNTLKVRVSPKQVGSFRVYARMALRRSDGSYAQAPVSGPTDQQGFWVKVATVTVEEPTVLADFRDLQVDPTRIVLGETVDVTLRGQNDGNVTSTDGYLSLTFPSLAARGDGQRVVELSGTSGDGTVAWYEVGSTLQTVNSTVTAQHLLAEWNEDNWTPGETNRLQVRVTPKVAGTFLIYGRVALQNPDKTTYSRDPRGGARDQQGFYVDVATVIVEDSVVAANFNGLTVDRDRIVLGESVEVTVSGSNSGNVGSTDGYLSLAFPGLTEGGDSVLVNNVSGRTSGDGTMAWYEVGSSLRTANADTTAEYLLVEWNEHDWQPGESNLLAAQVTPKMPGTFVIYGRMALQNPDWSSYQRAPTSGLKDQQDFFVEVARVTVDALDPLAVITGFIPSTIDIELGDSVDIRVFGLNQGEGAAAEGYLSLGFPALNRLGDSSLVKPLSGTSGDGDVSWHEVGDTLHTADSTMLADYLLLEWSSDDPWNPGERDTLLARVIPREAGTFVVEAHLAMAKSNGTFSRSPIATEAEGLNQQGFDVYRWLINVRAPPAPSAFIESFRPSFSQIVLGESVDITLTGVNAGEGPSAQGYLSLGFPSLTESADAGRVVELSATSTDGEVKWHEVASTLDADTALVTAEYLLTEWSTGDWQPNEVDSLLVRATPRDTGVFLVEASVAMRRADDTYSRFPSANGGSGKNQQGFRVAHVPITVALPRVVGVTVLQDDEPHDARTNPTVLSGDGTAFHTISVQVHIENPSQTQEIAVEVALNMLSDSLSGVEHPQLTERLFIPAAAVSTAEFHLNRVDLKPKWKYPHYFPRAAEEPVRIVPALKLDVAGSWVHAGTWGSEFSMTLESDCKFPLYTNESDDRLVRWRERSSHDDPRTVILVHGLELALSCNNDRLEAFLEDYWNITGSGDEWDSLIKQLKADGADVWVYRWPSHASIRAAGDDLRRRILTESRIDGNVTLVGHSFGGLVSIQAYAQGRGLRDNVEQVITLGTPHNGTQFGFWSLAVSGVEADPGNNTYLDSLSSSVLPADYDRLKLLAGHDGQDPLGTELGDGVVSLSSALAAGRYEESVRVAPYLEDIANGADILDWAFDGYCHGHIKFDYRSLASSNYQCVFSGIGDNGGAGLRSTLRSLLLKSRRQLSLRLKLDGDDYIKAPSGTSLGIQLWAGSQNVTEFGAVGLIEGSGSTATLLGPGPEFDLGMRVDGEYRVDVYQGGILIGQKTITVNETVPDPVPLELLAKETLAVTVYYADEITTVGTGYEVQIYDRTDPDDPGQSALQASGVTDVNGMADNLLVFPTHLSGGNGYWVRVLGEDGSQVAIERDVLVAQDVEPTTIAVSTNLVRISIAGGGDGDGWVDVAPIDKSCLIVSGVSRSNIPGSNCLYDVPMATDLVFSARPENESSFLSWSAQGISCSNAHTCTVTVVDHLAITAAFVAPTNHPIAMSIVPGAKFTEILSGTTELSADSVAVILTGTGSDSTGWDVTHGGTEWLSLVTSRGTGTGVLRWTRDGSILLPGLHVDTITVVAGSLSGSIVDSVLVVEPIRLLVEPSFRIDTILFADSTDLADSAVVSLTGTGGDETPWSATHYGAAWLTLEDSVGVGSGMLRWSASPIGLAVGSYYDAIVVTAAQMVDTVAVTFVVIADVVDQLVLTVEPSSRLGVVHEGQAELSLDSAAVNLAGPGADTTRWVATHGGGNWLTLVDSRGVGDGIIAWQRTPSGLSAGIYVDTITVVAGGAQGSPAEVIDSLVVLPPLTLEVNPSSLSDTATVGDASNTADSVLVAVSGVGADVTSWTATHTEATWLTLTDSTGTGSGVLRWTWTAEGLAIGEYRDTVVVATSDLADTVGVTLHVLPSHQSPSSFVEEFDDDIGRWVEYDVNGKITLDYTNDQRLEFANWIRTDGGYVAASTSVVDFTIDFDLAITQTFGNANWIGPGISTNLGTIDATENGVFAVFYRGSARPKLYLVLQRDAQWEHPWTDFGIQIPEDVPVYARLEKDGSTATLSVFTDSERTTHVTGSPRALETSLTDVTFTHLFAVNGWDHSVTGGFNTEWTSGWIDNIRFTSGGDSDPPPLSLEVNPASRVDSVVAGTTGTVTDSAAVTLMGTGADQAAWTAGHGAGSWLTVTTPGGTGSGAVRWSRNPTGLTAGTYVDTLTVTAEGAQGSPSLVVDTLVVLPGLTLAVNPASRVDSVIHGTTALTQDSAVVDLVGTGADTTTWTAQHGSTVWLSFVTASGTSTGVVRWTRDPSGLTPGTYVDTITVTAASLTANIIDTLVVLDPSLIGPLVLEVTPAMTADTIVHGSPHPPPDTAIVALTGLGADTISWQISHTTSAVRFEETEGVGSGIFRWRWYWDDPYIITVGSYVDTIVITAGVLRDTVIAHLEILKPLEISLEPRSTLDSVVEGSSVRVDSSSVTLTGAGANVASWEARHTAATWLTLTTAMGTGTGTVRWRLDPNGLNVGTYVDTIAVALGVSILDTITATSEGASPAEIVVTLVVLPALALDVSPLSRVDSAIEGTLEPLVDSAAVTLTGTGADTTNWMASHGTASWFTLTTTTGTGSGTVLWSRDPNGLDVGTYVDTITVTAEGALGSPVEIVDTLIVLTSLALEVYPMSRVDSAIEGTQEPLVDSVAVTLTGTGADTTNWMASHGTASWLTLTTTTATGSGTVLWRRDPTGLVEGTYVDTITVTAGSAHGSPAALIDTLVVFEPLAVFIDPTSKSDSVFEGSTLSIPHTATVLVQGTGADSASWTVTHGDAAWVTIPAEPGVGSGTLKWSRNATGLDLGVFTDTITVTVSNGAAAILVDTLRIVAPVDADEIIDKILSGQSLTTSQQKYLDMLGNGDGVFNLGDLLALFDRLGRVPSVPPKTNSEQTAAVADTSAAGIPGLPTSGNGRRRK